jgi:adenylate cyclase
VGVSSRRAHDPTASSEADTEVATEADADTGADAAAGADAADANLPAPVGDEQDESPTAELQRAVDLAETIGLARARYDREAILEKAGIEGMETTRWWRAMGIVEVPDGVRAFNSDDLAMVRALKLILSENAAAEDHVFRLARLLGGSFSRITEAQVEVIDDVLSAELPEGSLDTPAGRAEALRSSEAQALIEVFDHSLTYVWRRHMFAALGRWVGAEADQTTGTVGFIDISGFSQMSKRQDPEVLVEVIERFESAAIDVVSGVGGRVVKFIGDEAFFVVDDVPTAVDVALEVADRMAEGDPKVALHSGIASGPVVSIAGDVFGTTVNLAKRLTSAARKGKVVLPKGDAEVLADRDDLVIRRVPRVFEFKGVGRTAAVSVARRPADD